MSRTVIIPDLSISHQIGEQTIRLDPIDALVEIGRIATARKDCGNFEYLGDFAAWVKEKAGVEVSRDQADLLASGIRETYLRRKSKHSGTAPEAE